MRRHTALGGFGRYPCAALMLSRLAVLGVCGGQFDATSGHYRSNIIVFATGRT
jgi:hypothetical protein